MHQYEASIETLTMQNHFLQTQLHQVTYAPQVAIHDNDAMYSSCSSDVVTGGTSPTVPTASLTPMYYPTLQSSQPTSNITAVPGQPTLQATVPGLSTHLPFSSSTTHPTVQYSTADDISSGDNNAGGRGAEKMTKPTCPSASPIQGYSAFLKSEFELPPRFLSSSVRKEYSSNRDQGRRGFSSSGGYTYDTKYKHEDHRGGYDNRRGPRGSSSTELGSVSGGGGAMSGWGRTGGGGGGTGRPHYQQRYHGPKKCTSQLN